MMHIPLKYTLKQLLQIDGLFDATIQYLDYLMQDKTTITNFVQGTLWQKQVSQFNKTGCIVLPLFGYCDDVETGNSLGSHAMNNEVGAVYASIPCLPPHIASKLDSIVLSDIFYSNDRKEYGNAVIFKRFIEEFNELHDNGIEILLKGDTQRKIKVYFITSLILEDNLGMNSILGFTTSFAKTFWCRIFKANAKFMHV